MNKSFSPSRRQFLTQSVTAGAGLWMLNSCSTLEGSFQSDRKKLDREVVIIGGGLAGLTCAYYLKQQKVPFRLFEADRRLGGRVQTEQFGSSQQLIELGAEWIDPQHIEVKQLLQQLGLKAIDYQLGAKSESGCFFLKNKLWSFREVIGQSGNFFPLVKKIRSELIAGNRKDEIIYDSLRISDMAVFYDRISLHTLGEKYAEKMGPLFLSYLQTVIEEDFGRSYQDVSVYSFMRRYFCHPTSDFWWTTPRHYLRVQGGNEALCRSLEERISGVIPNLLVRKAQSLTEISYSEPYFNLHFFNHLTNETQTYRTQYLVLALPISCLRKISGFEDIPLQQSTRSALSDIRYSSHTLKYWGLKEKVSKIGMLTRVPLMSDLSNVNFKLAPNMPQSMDQVIQSRIVSGFHPNLSLQDSLGDLELVAKGIKTQLTAEVQSVDWAQRPWSLGSHSWFSMGKRFEGWRSFQQPDLNGGLVFAGEHTSLNNFNTMEGAVESGRRAADQMVAKMKAG